MVPMSRRKGKGSSIISRCKDKILDSQVNLLYDNRGVLRDASFHYGEKVALPCETKELQAAAKRERFMDKIYEQALLYDFYGDLLTEHQRKVYEAAVFDDMSLGEIAAEQGISRQGVHDLIKRCDKILSEYEEKLHLCSRFAKAKEKIAQIDALTQLDPPKEHDRSEAGKGKRTDMDPAGRLLEIRRLTKDLLDTL